MAFLDTLIFGVRTILNGGAELTQRSKLNFVSGFTVADNPVTGATDVTASGGTVSYGSPIAVGSANADGAATTVARSNHVHDHGSQTVGTMHAAVISGGTSGFMTGTDKAKVDLYPAISGLTANHVLTALSPTTVGFQAISATGLAAENYTGTYASRPAAGSAGRLAYFSDSPMPQLDNGSVWQNVVNGQRLVEPVAADLSTATNMGTSTFTQEKNRVRFGAQFNATAQLRMRGKAATVNARGSFVVSSVTVSASGLPGSGVYLRESGTGRVFFMGMLTGGGGNIFHASYWSSATVRTAFQNFTPNLAYFNSPNVIFDARVSGANVIGSYSPDGTEFFDFYTIAKSTVFTANPNEGGMAAYTQDTVGPVAWWNYFEAT